ncbi:MAG: NUDIX hydrolase [Candidatus Aenigmarchaeota archaeon]|nr:NUDIX hydrolase [Candidatus Aenigmarchaeota archaeon]
MEFPRVTVDGIAEIEGGIVLIKRLAKPFRGYWALPGGHVKNKESVEDATVREVKEETGLDVEIKRLAGVYSDPKRNPDKIQRIAIVFSCRKKSGRLKGGDDAAEAKLFSRKEISGMKLAFDHNTILADYFKKRPRK